MIEDKINYPYEAQFLFKELDLFGRIEKVAMKESLKVQFSSLIDITKIYVNQ